MHFSTLKKIVHKLLLFFCHEICVLVLSRMFVEFLCSVSIHLEFIDECLWDFMACLPHNSAMITQKHNQKLQPPQRKSEFHVITTGHFLVFSKQFFSW